MFQRCCLSKAECEVHILKAPWRAHLQVRRADSARPAPQALRRPAPLLTGGARLPEADVRTASSLLSQSPCSSLHRAEEPASGAPGPPGRPRAEGREASGQGNADSSVPAESRTSGLCQEQFQRKDRHGITETQAQLLEFRTYSPKSSTASFLINAS